MAKCLNSTIIADINSINVNALLNVFMRKNNSNNIHVLLLGPHLLNSLRLHLK